MCTVLPHSSDVEEKPQVTFALCRCKKSFPTVFFPLNTSPVSSRAGIYTISKALLEVRTLLPTLQTPPVHRRLHLVSHTQIPGEKEERGGGSQLIITAIGF